MEKERGRWRERERNSVEFPSTRNVPLRRQRSLNETLSAGYGILPLQLLVRGSGRFLHIIQAELNDYACYKIILLAS